MPSQPPSADSPSTPSRPQGADAFLQALLLGCRTPAFLLEEGRITQANLEATHLLGASHAEALAGRDFLDHVPVEARAEAAKHLQDALESGRPTEPQRKGLRRLDGGRVEAEWTAIPAGQGSRLLVLASPGPESPQGPEAACPHLAALVQQNRVAMAVSSWPEGRLEWVNSAWERMTGWAGDMLEGRAAQDLGIFPDADEVRSILQVLDSEGKIENATLTIRARDGILRNVLWSGQIVRTGALRQLVSSSVDITPQRRMEKALAASETHLRALLEAMPDSLFIFSRDGRFLSAHAAQDDALFMPAEIALGRRVQDIFPGELGERTRMAIQAACTGGTVEHLEYRLPAPGGDRHFEGRLVRIDEDSALLVSRDITTRRRVEADLQASRDLFASVLDRIRDGFVALDQDWRYTYVNRRAAALLHRDSPEDLIGRHIWTEYPEGVGQPFQLAYLRAMATQEPVFLEEHYEPWDQWFENRIYPSPEGLSIFFTEVTDRKRAERALRNSEAALNEAQRIAHIGNWELDLTTNRLNWSDEVFRIFELDPTRFGASYSAFLEAIHPEDREAVHRAYTDSLRTHTPYAIDHRLQMPDGRIKHVHEQCETHYDADGQPLRSVGTIQDLTERKLAELSLRARDAQFQAFTEHSPDILIQVDPSGRILYINRISPGRNPQEVLNHDWLQWILPGDRPVAAAALQRALESDEDVEFEAQGSGAGDALCWYHTRITRIQENGHPTSLLLFSTDISARRRMEEEHRALELQVQHAQKMESLGSLAGGVAHDMNNVLGAILGMASACREREVDGTPDARAMDTITKACERGRSLLRGLLDFARTDLVEERVLDLNALVLDEIRLLERTTLQKIRLLTELDPGLHPIQGDPGTLASALMNLCVNAVDAMPEGGNLTLRTWNEGAEAILAVQDTGTGMDPDVLAKALDPFFTTKPQGKGTGLGLSMVYGTVKAHRGRMEIRSEPGCGTQVELRFPSCLPEPRTVAAASAATPGTVRPLRVLLVDDDDLVRSSLEMLIQVQGHEAISATSGEEALAFLERGERFDVVILDVNMPGLGGAGALPRIRALQPGVPVLLATGRADQSALDLAAAYEGVTILPKPFTLKELRSHLAALA